MKATTGYHGRKFGRYVCSVKDTLNISRMKTQYLGCNEHQDTEIHLQGETVKGVHSHTWDRRWRMMENWMRKSPAECRVQGGCNNWQRVSVVLCHTRMKVKIKG